MLHWFLIFFFADNYCDNSKFLSIFILFVKLFRCKFANTFDTISYNVLNSPPQTMIPQILILLHLINPSPIDGEGGLSAESDVLNEQWRKFKGKNCILFKYI